MSTPLQADLLLSICHLCSQFVRLAHDTEADVMYDMMTKHWGMEEPQLLISVTGGAKKFNLDPRLKQHFASGLLKVGLVQSGELLPYNRKVVGSIPGSFNLTSE